MNYYYVKNGDMYGPILFETLYDLHKSGAISADTQICAEGSENWQSFSSLEPIPVDLIAAPAISGSPPIISQQAFPQAADTIFFNERGVLVSKTRFVVAGHTFAVSGITSVRGHIVPPRREWPVVLLIIGVICLIIYVGVLLIIAAIIWMFKQKPTYQVTLTMASSEVMAYESSDKNLSARILAALNQAIISRG